VIVLGGTGYVSGEILRLLVTHPSLRVAAVVSTSADGGSVAAAFPQLAGTEADSWSFVTLDAAIDGLKKDQIIGILAATPHGATAAMLDRVLSAAEAVGADARAVDLSADFRYPDAASFERVYGQPHGAPGRLAQFTCGVPEHVVGVLNRHAAQPGCFTTAVSLAAYPFLAMGLVEPTVFACAVTGSSGSGRTPSAGTHHPDRHSDMRAYSPLVHRHEPEMRRLLAAANGGIAPDVDFVPHSGPFVRGIHATVRMTLVDEHPADELVEAVNCFYETGPFVRATTMPPRLRDVIGTNRACLGVAARGSTLVVTSVIDNLVKGAAGGGIQWLNRLMGYSDDRGLIAPGLGWY
jgi:N-acetyl-gamma-glutamyl-phosphate reductase